MRGFAKVFKVIARANDLRTAKTSVCGIPCASLRERVTLVISCAATN